MIDCYISVQSYFKNNSNIYIEISLLQVDNSNIFEDESKNVLGKRYSDSLIDSAKSKGTNSLSA